MYLFDRIHEDVAAKGRPGEYGVTPAKGMRIFEAQMAQLTSVASAIASAPRFILEADVTEAICDVLLSRPSSIRDIVSVLRCPWPAAWFEWTEGDRFRARAERGILDPNNKETPRRIGMLVEADETGRRGVVRLSWDHDAKATEGMGIRQMANICPIVIRFDFDALEGAVPEGDERVNSDLYRKWQDKPAEIEAIDAVNQTMLHDIDDLGQKTLDAFGIELGDPGATGWLAQNSYEDIAGEALHFVAMLAMLTARNGVTEEPVSMARLNKSRRKKGRTELLDHVVTRMRLGKGDAYKAGEVPAGTTGGRSAPRAHLVRGHFCRRGEQIWWRRAHVRGHGERVRRTYKVAL